MAQRQAKIVPLDELVPPDEFEAYLKAHPNTLFVRNDPCHCPAGAFISSRQSSPMIRASVGPSYVCTYDAIGTIERADYHSDSWLAKFVKLVDAPGGITKVRGLTALRLFYKARSA